MHVAIIIMLLVVFLLRISILSLHTSKMFLFMTLIVPLHSLYIPKTLGIHTFLRTLGLDHINLLYHFVHVVGVNVATSCSMVALLFPDYLVNYNSE